MAYNLTRVENSTQIFTFVQEVNVLTGNLYALLILAGLFIVLMVAMKRFDTLKSAVASSFIVAFIGTIFAFVQLMPWEWIFFPLLLFFATVIALLFNNGGN